MKLADFYLILTIWCCLAVLCFIALLFIPAPYGRHHKKRWKPYLNGTIGWIIMECPAALTFAWFYITGNRVGDFYSTLFLILWELHYVHRAFIFAWRRRYMAKPISLYIVLMGMCFNACNGFLNSYWINSLAPSYPAQWLLNPLFMGGICLFFLGFGLNLIADEKLLKLKREGGGNYQIPQGSFYTYITCPNYLGEMIEWTGYALATFSPAAFAFVFWTAANLIPRALSHHHWYQHHFDHYPKNRKAIFPFLL